MSEIAFRLVYHHTFPAPNKGWMFAIATLGLTYRKRGLPEFTPGRSLLEISHLKAGWFVTIFFIHVVTFSKIFWKGVF